MLLLVSLLAVVLKSAVPNTGSCKKYSTPLVRKPNAMQR